MFMLHLKEMFVPRTWWLLLLLTFLMAGSVGVEAQERPPRARLQVYQTPYYILHTDLEPEHAREAAIRMTKMAEEYHRRTADFSRRARGRLPFYLYRFHHDYIQAGGVPGTSGFFDGTTLRAVTGPEPTDATWHVIQHEGFHQFIRQVIGGDIPVWANEGLADYFGEAQWTGDGFVTGLIPQWRLQRVRQRLSEGAFRPIEDMMNLSYAQWKAEFSRNNYDQAWMMVHFLAHGEEGRYQRAFGAFLGLISRGKQWPVAWKETFGDTQGFEQRWRDYWMNLPDHPTADLYAQVTVATLTSFLARAASQQQQFADIDSFLDTARSGELKMHPDDWLPRSLLLRAVEDAYALRQAGHRIELQSPPARWSIVCTMIDGTQVTGRYTLRGRRIGEIHSETHRIRSAEGTVNLSGGDRR